MPALTLAAAAAFAEHVRRMLAHFDFGHHLRVNVALGDPVEQARKHRGVPGTLIHRHVEECG